MSDIYRSYEVLIEETASNHKTRGAGKARKALKPHSENTCRALRVTHELFQDAVCYYILCLAGLVRDERDKNGEPINRIWGCLSDNSETAAVLTRLARRYPSAPFHKARELNEFLAMIYGWKLPDPNKPTSASLRLTYRILFQQAVKTGEGEDQSSALENLKTFAGNWIAILCNEDGDTTIPGQGVFDKLHRELKKAKAPNAEAIWKMVKPIADEASQAKAVMDASWGQRESEKRRARNASAKSPKSTDEMEALCSTALDEKLGRDREGLKDLFLRAFSPEKTKKYCSLGPDAINSATNDIRAASSDDKRFQRLRYGARDNSMEQPLFRFLWLREDAKYAGAAAGDLLEYVAKERPEAELLDDDNRAVNKMPYQETGKEPLFPYFTNCLGIERVERAAWFEFDKSAFKRAAEEVFKYKIRSDARGSIARERRGKLTELERAIQGDPRPGLIEKLLAELGGAIGYGMRRATIGGWADLRQEFLKIAQKGGPIAEDELIKAVGDARNASGGGFGSGALFKALCEEQYHPLWAQTWENKQDHHPGNFVRWWVLYSEAKDELEKVWDEQSKAQKPISFTWPGTENRHGKTSFRPLDFDVRVGPLPEVDLFDREGEEGPVKLVRANAKPPKQNKSKEAKPAESFTDADGSELYPLTLSFRRLKRDRIAHADGSSIEAKYAPPLVVGDAPPLHQKGKKDENGPLDVSAVLLPADARGCWHMMLSFGLGREARKRLAGGAVKIPGEKSVRTVKKSGKWVGLNFRWPIDGKTEKQPESGERAAASANGDGVEEADAKFSAKKIWCASRFEPFELLSVDLGVRYAGAWCRGRVKIGRDDGRPTQREVSSSGHGQEIVYDAYDFGTFRLQGEDAKIWRKDKQNGFASGPAPEKCGSRGRIASDIERAEFAALAERVLPASPRFPIPSDPIEVKFFPNLAEHLTYRLRRRLARVRFLFKLRWQISGKKKKIGHEYKDLSGAELEAFRGEQRFNAIAALAFTPREGAREEPEDDFMKSLRLSLAPDEVWSGLAYQHDGSMHPLFAKVKGGASGGDKQESRQKAEAQREAKSRLRGELQSGGPANWHWEALDRAAEGELRAATLAFAGENSIIAGVARFVWPLRDKRWKWKSCSIGAEGKAEESLLERDENSVEPRRPIHGMRGLNMKRIRLMQDFRQCCQSLAKLERRFHTEENHGLEPSPVRFGDTVHEPAQAFLDKINELREQRVYQTAHLILAEALGLELMNPAAVRIDGKLKPELKSERDLHGRYEQKKPRVAAIVLEDLSRYRTSQDRSRHENTQLMEWSHRAIIAKLQDMAQVFGVQIITVDARFSSRFCSRTGVPGVRCAQVAKGFEAEYPWKKWAEEKDERAKLIQSAADSLKECDDSKFTLVLPMDGGPAFFPVVPHAAGKEGLETNADINAAVNIGLRAVAHPDRLDIFPVLRTEAVKGEGLEIKNKRGSLSELVAGREERTVSPAAQASSTAEDEGVTAEDADGGEELETGKFPYLYVAVRDCVSVDDRNRYPLPRTFDGRNAEPGNQAGACAAKGKIYWTRVKRECWRRIKQVNARRLRSRNIKPPAGWDGPLPGNAESPAEREEFPW